MGEKERLSPALAFQFIYGVNVTLWLEI